MQIESLAVGSIIVRLRITVQDPEFPVDASTFAPVLSYLQNGSVLVVDQQNTAVEGNFWVVFFGRRKQIYVLIMCTITNILHKIEKQRMWFVGENDVRILSGVLT